MKNTVKAGFYAVAGTTLLAINSAHAAIGFDAENQVNSNLQGSGQTADNVLEIWMGYLTGFLYLIAIAMILWGAFNILTAAGDEEKVKKWKTVILQAIAGLVVVFIANSIILWVINGLFASTAG